MGLDDELFKDVPQPQSPLQQSRHVPDAPFVSTELRRPSSLPQRQNKGSPPPGAICCRLAHLAGRCRRPALSWSGVIWRAYVALAFAALHWGSPLEDLESAQLRRCSLPDRLGVTLVIDRSRPWKGGLWMNPIITYSAVPTCICLFPLTHQTTILRTRRRVVQDRLAAVAQYCICVAYMGLRSGVIKHNMGLLDFTSHHATPRYRSAQLHESTIDPNVLHEKPR